MRESKDFINDILLKNIDKEITINFSLLTTPVKDNPSMSKKTLPLLVKLENSTKLENYIDENYDKAAKIQLKQAILREVKQQFPNETKEKGHLDELLRSFHNQISSIKSETDFIREK